VSIVKSRAPVKPKPYRSKLRDAQAQQTRLAIIEAADQLYVERGYGATSIDAIAERAGVGRATVFNSVGGKLALLKAAYDIAIVGDDEPVPLPQRPWAQPVRDAKTQTECLERYADVVTLVGRRVAPIAEAFRGAAGADPEVREVWDEIRVERRGGAATVVRFLTDLGPLRSGLDATTAADIVWIHSDPGLYHQLVVQRRWSPSKFRKWAAQTLIMQLLEP
jgi:AcrR family transcriptional regulator